MRAKATRMSGSRLAPWRPRNELRGGRGVFLALVIFLLGPAGSAQAAPPVGALAPLAGSGNPPCIVESGGSSPCRSVPGGLTNADAAAITPDGKNVYVVGAQQGTSTSPPFSGNTLTVLSRDPAGGSLTFNECLKDASSTEACVANAPGLVNPTSVAVSPDGKYVYVGSSGSNGKGGQITVFDRASDGTLSPALGTGSSMAVPAVTAMAITPSGSGNAAALYAVSHEDPQTTGLYVLPITSSNGFLSAGPCYFGLTSVNTPPTTANPPCTSGTTNSNVPGLSGVNSVAISPDGADLYTTSSVNLTPSTTSSAQTCQQSTGPAASVPGKPCSAVDEFTIQASGALAAPPKCLSGTLSNETTGCTAASGVNGADAVAVSPDGRNVYVAAGPVTQTTAAQPMSSSAKYGDSVTAFSRPSITEVNCLGAATVGGATNNEACATTPAKGLQGAGAIAAAAGAVFVGSSTGAGNGELGAFARSAGNGALAQVPSPNDCLSEGSAADTCGTAALHALSGVGGGMEAPSTAGTGTQGLPETLLLSPDTAFAYAVSAPTETATVGAPTSSNDKGVSAFTDEVAPVCTPVTNSQVPSGVATQITLSCTDVNASALGESWTYSLPGGTTTAHGKVTAPPSSPTTGPVTVTYTSTAPGYTGPDSFTFIATDSAGNASAPTTVNLTVVNSTAALTLSDASVQQQTAGSQTLTFPLTMSAIVAGDVTVNWSTTTNCGANAGVDGEDFNSVSGGTVTIPAGSLTPSTPIQVTVPAETEVEPVECVGVVLNSTSGQSGISFARGQAFGSIYNTAESTINVGNATVDESTPSPTATFTVSLSNPVSTPVSVQVNTADGTAVAGTDYTALPANTTVTFNPGQTTQTVAVPIIDDGVPDQTETFSVNLSNPSGGPNGTIPIGTGSGTGTITDSRLPSLSVSSSSVYPGASGATLPFVVSLNAQVSSPVTVSYATADGTAHAGSDYTATSGSLSFAPGQTSQVVNVPVSPAKNSGQNTTFTLNLSNPANATIANGAATGTIVNNAVTPAAPAPPALFVSDTALATPVSGTVPAKFTVSLSSPQSVPVSVGYSTHDGSATTRARDYRATAGTLTFAPGETSKVVSVTVNGDPLFEQPESFRLVLSAPSGAVISKGTGSAMLVSSAPRQQCRVPNLTGKTVGQATRALSAAGCALGRVLHRSSGSKAGRIIGQSPGTGRITAQHTPVSVVVSSGRRKKRK